tara:strand:+ start:2759 stop:3466 length:708 start_codon:yes stop_codon:yes gene_type:complete
MDILINQPFGIGDVLFSEPIARHYHNLDKKVVWPVNDEYIWVQDYITYVNFVKKSEYAINYEQCSFGTVNGMEYIPLRFANPLHRNKPPHDYSGIENCMEDKYRLLKLPTNLWRTLDWTRNIAKEQALFSSLNLENKEYTLVNTSFGASGQSIEIQTDDDELIVQMEYVPGYTMLDWGLVIEKATKIHTVSTSLIYMIEKLTIDSEIHLYPRLPNETTLRPVELFISDRWIKHEY